MNVELLLSRLQHVRRSGNHWRADCPNGHQHAHGSLAITVAEDGRLLLTCFACHDTPAILTALGLELADLYPERIRDPSPEARQRAREAFKRDGWRAALNVLGRESTCVMVAAGTLARGEPLNPDDYARLELAYKRIEDARAVLA